MEETKTLQEEYSPTDAKREKVRRVAVAMIDDFPEHPFTGGFGYAVSSKGREIPSVPD